MPRSSRHKSHKQSKHSSKEVKEYSDSEGEDVRMKESGSARVSKDSGHSASGEKRKLASQLKEGKDLSGHGNGEAAEEYVSSKRRKEKADTSAGGDRWNGGGDERGESGGLEKEGRGESSKIDGEKGSKSREQSRSKGSKRHESGGERKEDNVGSVVEKEEGRSGSRSESKRRSEREKEGKEVREKERGSEREKKGLESKRDPEAYLMDGDVIKKQGTQPDDFGEERQGRRSRNDTEWRMQDELQNPEFEKESEKRIRKKREGSGDADKYLDDYRDSDEKRLSSRGDRVKEAKYRDEKHKEGNYADMYGEDGDRDDRHRDYKYREDADRGNKHREDFDRDSRHRDDKYRDDGDRDSRRRDDKYREDGDRDNRRRDDKYWENGEKDSRRRDDKYREDGERDNKRKYREDGEKESRSSDGRYQEDADRDGKHKDEKHREDVERDNRHKEEKHRDDYERESRQRDGKQADDVDREKRRLRETKYRDERGSKDRSSDKSVTKRLRDENHASDLHSRKASMHDSSPGYDDRTTRYKDDQGRRKIYHKEDHGDFRSQGPKDQLSDVEKRSAGSGRLELATDRGRSTSRNADVDLAATHSRRHSSPSSSSHVTRDQYRISKQDESKYRDYAYEDRSRHNLTSGREYAGAAGSVEKKLFQKDDSHFGDLATERRLRSNARNSPLPLVDKSPSSTSTERRHLSRSDVRRSLDIEESGQRSGGSRDGKDYSVREGRGSREVVMETFQGDDPSQAEGDNLSVSSPYTRIGSLSSNSKSLLPPPSFRSGVDSPLPFGASEDDSRGKSNNRHRRIGDPNMGRFQGNSWRGVPNWPSPMANGFMPFQHGPPPVGFHPVMQQFPAPPIFGVRPSMELNHPGVPFHVPDAERFSGHGRPMGWRNPADDSCPPPLHGWDANNAAYGEDSHIFGRPDWDGGRSVLSGRGWETSGDMWKGPNSSGSAELLSAPAKENHSTRGGEDQSLGGQSGLQARPDDSQPDLQDESNETSRQSDAPGKKGPETLKFNPEETPNVDKLKEDDDSVSHLYFSKLDISADLAEPELYIQCTDLLDMDNSPIFDVQCTGLLEQEFMEDRETRTNQVRSTLFFGAANNTVFQKAVTLYKKHKEEFKVPSRDSVLSSSVKNECVMISAEEDLGSKGGVAEELAVAADDESENVLPNFSKEVELPASFKNLGAGAAASEKVAAADMVDKSEDSVFTTSNTSMEVHVTSDVEATDHIIDDNSVSVQNVGQAIDHSPAGVEDAMMPNSSIGDLSASTNEGKELVDTKCDPLLLSDVPEACEGVMAESVESGLVNLSGIHHSPESTR